MKYRKYEINNFVGRSITQMMDNVFNGIRIPIPKLIGRKKKFLMVYL